MTVVVLKGTQAGFQELTLRHDDHVEPRRDLISTENLSNQSLSSVSLNRATQLFCGRDAKTTDG